VEGELTLRRPPRTPVKQALAPALALAVLTLLLAPLPLRGAEPAERPVAVVDLHVDLSYETNYQGRPFATGSGQFRAADLARAGVVGVVLPLFVPREVAPGGPRVSDFESSYARVYGELAHTPPFRLPGCLPADGGVKTWFAFEGSGPLASTPEALTGWAARGVRIVAPVHTWHNELASSSGDHPAESFGLTAAGKTFARAAVRAGMLLDVSHASDRAARELLAVAAQTHAPVVATHSNARALAAHPRNLADRELTAIAQAGGVVGVNFHSPFVVSGRPATLADVVRQVRYLVRVMGATHVAIGSDFEGDIRPPAELADVSGYQRLAAALARDGLTREEIAAIFSRNALRLLCPAASQTGGDSTIDAVRGR
jgi:membrane dipeptidase